MQPPTLLVDDLVLDSPRLTDAEDWAAAQDDECARWFGWPARPGVERCRAHLATVLADADPHTFVWAIRSPEGFAGGIDVKLHDGCWNVAYFVDPRQRRRGIATRALRRVTTWACEERGLGALGTTVHGDNLSSRKVLEACGFTVVREQRIPTRGSPRWPTGGPAHPADGLALPPAPRSCESVGPRDPARERG